ncbi:MAG: 50S ribosomal protein L9 [Pseudomonadota bacterium]
MDVILLEKIGNLGVLGDKVSVKSGYARNYLIPQGKAKMATPENLREFEERRAELEAQAAEQLATAQARAEKLDGLEVTIKAKTSGENKLFGSVGTADIVDAVNALGGEQLEKKELRLPEGSIRELGEFAIGVHLHADIDIEIKLTVAPED